MKDIKLLLAPMDSLTHQAFRNLVFRFGGCDEYFNEMINASSLLNNGPWEKYYLLDGPEPQKLVWQLTDKSGEKLAGAASLLCEHEGIGIDINMGCSAPQIVKTGAGIAWMLKPLEETAGMIHCVKSAIVNNAKDGKKQKRLSVKLRLGDDKYTEERLFNFCEMLISEGVEMITLHARTQKQKHSRHSDWSAVNRLCERFSDFPIVLNGDVKDIESLSLALRTAPAVSAVMIATGAAQKPWIFRELKDFLTGCKTETKIAALELALTFIDELEKFQPEEFWKTRIQRFFAYYCLNFSFGHYFQSQMLNHKDNDDARRIIIEYFNKCSDDRFICLGRAAGTGDIME